MKARNYARGRVAVLGAVLGLVCFAAPAAAQRGWRNVVMTGGVSIEGYQGNLAAVTVPLVDSTEKAAAAVGEFGARGDLVVLSQPGRSAVVSLDAGLRQFAAAGFELRDYAPRELVGSADLRFNQRLAEWGVLQVGLNAKGRSVQDRPPMPLFIQPGYGATTGTLRVQTRAIRGVRLDAAVRGEWADYHALDLTPQLDLLDRTSAGMEVGAEWGGEGSTALRFYTGYRATRYPEQGSFDPADPYRRDRTVRAGTRWTLNTPVLVQLGVEGTINRSNSRRPEYDAVSVRAGLSAPLPADFGLNLYGVLTAKSYFSPTDFARLVPGEEADNASVVYLSLTRSLAANLDGAVRLGWTRAETDIGDAYFQRYGAAFLLHFRPSGN